MEITRRIYGLHAAGDKTIRYVGETYNVHSRKLEHLNFRTQGMSAKSFWVARCINSEREIRVRTLETVNAPSVAACRRLSRISERHWINAFSERGVRLLNDRLWFSHDLPESVVLVWEHLYLEWLREANRRSHEKREYYFNPEALGLIQKIEEDFPALNILDYKYERACEPAFFGS